MFLIQKKNLSYSGVPKNSYGLRVLDEGYKETPKANAKLENLALDLIKTIYREIISRKKLERYKSPIFKIYQKSTEMIIEEIDKLAKLWNFVKTDNADYRIYSNHKNRIRVENNKFSSNEKMEKISDPKKKKIGGLEQYYQGRTKLRKDKK
ncbi:7957_t:CDS:2, partial [Gigaspora margarita]